MFTKITQTDPNYNAINDAISSQTRNFNYDALADAYDQLAVNELLQFEFPKAKRTSIVEQLEKRGLVESRDVKVSAIEVNSGKTEVVDGKEQVIYIEFVVVKRLSDLNSTPVAPVKRGRKPAEGGGEATGGEATGGSAQAPATPPQTQAAPAAAAPAAGATRAAPARRAGR